MINPIDIPFESSARYWEARYQNGGNSGAGSYGKLAEYKASFINDFISTQHIHSVIEWGCGDGNQLSLLKIPYYVGVDVSNTALTKCKKIFADDKSKQFLAKQEVPRGVSAELALSLDVIFHLVEDSVFKNYLSYLFASASKFVIIYSSNTADLSDTAKHVRHRRFTDYIERERADFELVSQNANPFPWSEEHPLTTSFSDFYVYRRQVSMTPTPAKPIQ